MNENRDGIVAKIKRCVFNNDFETSFKALSRQSSGNKEEAYRIITRTAKHYGMTVTEMDIDIALGEMNNGVEIEWPS